MKTIWKYTLKVDEGVQEIEMPQEAQILTVALQDDRPTIWAECDPERARAVRRFCIYGTGQPFVKYADFKREYVGTSQIVGLIGTLVGHVFELK